jgi:hypothetical protein
MIKRREKSKQHERNPQQEQENKEQAENKTEVSTEQITESTKACCDPLGALIPDEAEQLHWVHG